MHRAQEWGMSTDAMQMSEDALDFRTFRVTAASVMQSVVKMFYSPSCSVTFCLSVEWQRALQYCTRMSIIFAVRCVYVQFSKTSIAVISIAVLKHKMVFSRVSAWVNGAVSLCCQNSIEVKLSLFCFRATLSLIGKTLRDEHSAASISFFCFDEQRAKK